MLSFLKLTFSFLKQTKSSWNVINDLATRKAQIISRNSRLPQSSLLPSMETCQRRKLMKFKRQSMNTYTIRNLRPNSMVLNRMMILQVSTSIMSTTQLGLQLDLLESLSQPGGNSILIIVIICPGTTTKDGFRKPSAHSLPWKMPHCTSRI